MRLVPKSLQIQLPFGLGGVSVDLSEEAARAAWALHVELATRIAREPLQEGQGSVREALGSLHALFGVTRQVLREGGPDVGRASKKHESVASITIRILNEGIRPPLLRWHTSLSRYEAACWKEWLAQGHSIPDVPGVAAALVDESAWEGYPTFFDELAGIQRGLLEYLDLLEDLSGSKD